MRQLIITMAAFAAANMVYVSTASAQRGSGKLAQLEQAVEQSLLVEGISLAGLNT